MFARMKRIIKSFIGMFIEMAEDPELILKQNIRDMQDQIPNMNKSIASVRAAVTLLEKESRKLNTTKRDLSAKVQAALKVGRRDIALTYATQLEQVRRDLISTEGQLKLSKLAYEKSQKVKKTFMRQIETKSKEAMSAIRAKHRAQWQAKVADAMSGFQVTGIDATHDEMIRRIEEESAQKEAMLEVALDNVDHEALQIEEEAKKLQANDTLRQFELQMGLIPQETAAPLIETSVDKEESISITPEGEKIG